MVKCKSGRTINICHLTLGWKFLSKRFSVHPCLYLSIKPSPEAVEHQLGMNSSARSVSWFLGTWWSELTEENTKITLSLTSVGFSISPLTWFAFIWEPSSPKREPFLLKMTD